MFEFYIVCIQMKYLESIQMKYLESIINLLKSYSSAVIYDWAKLRVAQLSWLCYVIKKDSLIGRDEENN